MADVEDVEEIAGNLEMNEREKARYELHLEGITKYSKKANFWIIMNIVWQVIFFWGLVVLAISTGRDLAIASSNAMLPFFNFMDWLLSPMNLLVAIVGPFSFFLMIWTGMVRRKWEGKLTRATAYALAFLSNIEHREFMKMEEEQSKLRDEAFEERKMLLKAAYDEGKMSKELYEQNLERIEKMQ